MTKRHIFQLITIAVSVLLPFSAMAATCQSPPSATPEAWFSCIINNILTGLVWPLFAGLIVLMSLIAGFLFVTARGKEDQINTAKKMMIWIAVGIIVGLVAYSVEGIVRELLGLT